MSQAFQQKLDRFHARYTNDTSVPPDQVIELCADLHDLISVLTGRVTQLEQDMALRPIAAPSYRDPRG